MKYLTAVLLLLSIDEACAQWTLLPGPSGAKVIAFSNIGPIEFMATSSEIFLTTNEGATWTRVDSLRNYDVIQAMTAIGPTLFYSTYYNGVFSSKDSGRTWYRRSYGLPDADHVYSLVADSGNLFALTETNGIYRSTNLGSSWNPMNDGVGQDMYGRWYFATLGSDGPYLFASIGQSIYRNIPGGGTWTDMHLAASDPNIGTTSITGFTASGPYLFVGTDKNGVYRTTLDGRGYRRFNSGLTDSSIVMLRSSGTTIYAVTKTAIFTSKDYGESWYSVSTNLPLLSVTDLSISNGVLYTGTSTSVFVTTDDGLHWQQSSNGLDHARISVTTADHYNVPAMTSFHGDLLVGTDFDAFRSSDLGESWVPLPIPTRGDVNATCFANTGSILFAGTQYGLLESTNTGDLWVNISNGLNYTWIYSVVAEDSLLVATTIEPIHDEPQFGAISHDMGATWRPIDTLCPVTCSVQFAGYTYIGGSSGNGGVIFRTSDKGYTWEEIDSGVREFGIYGGYTPDVLSLLTVGSNIFAVASDGMYLTTDSGFSWKKRPGILSEFPVINSLSQSGNNLFAATRNGVFVSTDIGATWLRVVRGLGDTNVKALIKQDTFLFAATSSGIFRRSLSDINSAAILGTDQGSKESVPSLRSSTSFDVRISPNPATNEIGIESSSDIESLSIVNLLGQHFVDAPHILRSKSYLFDISKLPCGPYFVSISTMNGVDVKTIVKK